MKPTFYNTSIERSRLMAKVKRENTSIEIICRKALFTHGFRFRKNVRTLPGSPDIVLKKYSTVIFVNGCFWHHHKDCKKARIPITNIDY